MLKSSRPESSRRRWATAVASEVLLSSDSAPAGVTRGAPTGKVCAHSQDGLHKFAMPIGGLTSAHGLHNLVCYPSLLKEKVGLVL